MGALPAFLLSSLLATGAGPESVLIPYLLAMAEEAQEHDQMSYEVVELFRAESPEELEAVLTDGYPPAWLEEVLSDTTIPEEDRYWLDCRMRASIAQDLHVFYDRRGEVVGFEADWIMPGEDYWRETMIVDPVGLTEVDHPVATGGKLRLEPGLLVNSVGEVTGEIAHTAVLIGTSRDGTLAASGLLRVQGQYRLVLMRSDGSVIVPPIEMSYGRCGVSPSGEYVILAAYETRWPGDPDYIPPRVILLDRDGEILWERELPMNPVGNTVPVVSPNDSCCAVTTSSVEGRQALVYNIVSGEVVLAVDNQTGSRLSFSPAGRFLCISGFGGSVYDLDSDDLVWTDSMDDWDDPSIGWMMYLDCTNDARILCALTKPGRRVAEEALALFDSNRDVMLYDPVEKGNIDLSPSGCFVITENYYPRSHRYTTPLAILRIRGGA